MSVMIDNLTREEEKVLLGKTISKLMNDPRTSDWEKQFLSSIAQQISSKDLSDKQKKILEKIRQKCSKP